MSNIVYVDENDTVIGAGPRKEAIAKGIAHRVARVFLFNSKAEILIQKRAFTLDSYPGLWDQSAAGHVDEGEEYDAAAVREMTEEVGATGVVLHKVGKYYSEEPEEGVLKKRFNMLYTGDFDGVPITNAEEVSETRWIPRADLEAWIVRAPDDFTPGSVRAFHYLQERK